MPTISEKEKRDIERLHGWAFLDDMSIVVPVNLTNEEKLELGEKITSSIQEIEELESEKKAFNDRIKGQIADVEENLRLKARELRRGKKDEEKIFPVFYEPITDQRHYFDHETGEIILSEPGQLEDRQMKLGA